jgi:ABC-type enterochelin transport system substrate-binding protein
MSIFSWLFGGSPSQDRKIRELQSEVAKIKRELVVIANMTGRITSDLENLAKIFAENREAVSKLAQMYMELTYEQVSLQTYSDDKNRSSLSLSLIGTDDDDDLIN